MIDEAHAGTKISIHTLHTEGDDMDSALARINWISIHTLHTEGD